MKINKKKSLYSLYLEIIKRQEAEIQDLLRPAQASLSISWVQAVKLLSK
jgi:hypothetical protein